MEGWQSGRMHLTANEAGGNASEVRILRPPQKKGAAQGGLRLK